ncbi:MAG: radical SAM protein, partial [Lachnospiraceae bacterium]|nr:radical SAM protein [Lachnospiraceae bacterium]
MKVCFFSLGCDKNKTDSEKVLSYLLKNYDIEIVGEPEEADIAIVNTCSFIRDAKEESISTIKHLENIKKKTGLKVLLMGCLTNDKSVNLLKIIKKDDVILPIDKYLSDLYNVDDRIMNVLSFSSSIKISDGCDKNCSYCIIPKLRGSYKSNTIDNIYNEAKKLVDGGTRELNIVAQDTLNYGIDIYHKRSIVPLIK